LCIDNGEGFSSSIPGTCFTTPLDSQASPKKCGIGDGDKAINASIKNFVRNAQIRRGKRARYLETFFPRLSERVKAPEPAKLPIIPKFPSLMEALESAVLLSTKAAECAEKEQKAREEEYMGPPPPPPTNKVNANSRS
jgi:hypothetical protein